ncbi:MAG: hypothetical protein U9O24_05380 [Campylobacterota bacterium]|nr:hypothetical protein [Campylobacterota bacterium]
MKMKKYAKGIGVTQSFKKAVYFSKKGCDLGNGRGCSNLGKRYRHGKGVTKNFKE